MSIVKATMSDHIKDLRAEIGRLRAALIDATDSFESQCSSWDEWCGLPSCPKCGHDAKKIAAWRGVIQQLGSKE